MTGLAVVTGAGGHLGGAVVRALEQAGRPVRAVDVRTGFVIADVLVPEQLRRAFDGADVVYHLAAMISIAGDPDGRVWATNVVGVRNVCDAAVAAGVRRVVHCSSVHAFDAARAGAVIDETSPAAIDPTLPRYDRSKAFGEQAVRRAVAGGLDAVIVNPTAIIGPPDPGPSRMGRVLRAVFKGRVPAMVGGAFDWVDVRDVATGVLAAGDRGATGESYLLGGTYRTAVDLCRLAAAGTGRGGPRWILPPGLARLGAEAGVRVPSPKRWGGGPLFTPEALHALESGKPVSHEKAGRVLGYQPRLLDETLLDLSVYFAVSAGHC